VTRSAFSQSANDNNKQIVLIIENHIFSPSEIHVPAAHRIKLLVQNRDNTAEEFDSTSLKVEKVIAGRGEAVVQLTCWLWRCAIEAVLAHQA
jgi:hypothetical protein